MIGANLMLSFAHKELVVFLSYNKNKINSDNETLSLLKNKKNRELNNFQR
ncbi:predicted protein [Francisella philomiragia subsp. philomiragia ATCC 25015]|nr:predicted protein [Francisella philomiragia subsp. philomiragia ATCC 25015]